MYTGKWNQIVFTTFWLIWNWTDVRLVPNQSKNGKYNLISGWFNKISKRFLGVYIHLYDSDLYSLFTVYLWCIYRAMMPRDAIKLSEWPGVQLRGIVLGWWGSNTTVGQIACTEKTVSISCHIEWDMIVVTVFHSILNQIEFHLVQNRKENCHNDHIPFNVKGNPSIVFSM